MAPSGGYKGFGVGLMVELLASAAAGALPSADTSPFSGPTGGPPRTGQFFIAMDAGVTSGGQFAERITSLVRAIVDQEGTRLQGARRAAHRAKAEHDGVAVPTELLESIARIVSSE
jgi:(2R)-3-sulfolactate dehydrogenase (NADP+)